MVFDTRGRRKHVVRVVYAILALLMGASLFLVVGPFNIATLFGGSTTSEAAKVLDERAEVIEKRLRTEPDNTDLLLSLTRARSAAGNAQTEVNPETGISFVTGEGLVDLIAATEAWERYEKQAKPPNPSGALLIAGTYFTLAERSFTLEEAESNIEKAADAQRIVAAARPSAGSLSNLAIYEYFANDFTAGDQAARQAAAKVPKAEAKEIEKQMAEYRARGEAFEKQKTEIAKSEKSQRKEALENPFGGLGGSSGSLGQ